MISLVLLQVWLDFQARAQHLFSHEPCVFDVDMYVFC